MAHQDVLREIAIGDIARAVEALAYEYGENPLTLDLSLHANAHGWWVEMGMDYPYTWPTGTARIDWDGAGSPLTSRERHQAMNAEFRRSMAWYRHRRFPSWSEIEAQQQQILETVAAIRQQADSGFPPSTELGLIATGLGDVHQLLVTHWENIETALERERDTTARARGLNRYTE